MKKLAVVSGLILSSLAFADIDYSRCNQVGMGYSSGMIDNDGKFQPLYGMVVTGVETKGKEETYKLKYENKNFGLLSSTFESEVTIVRDDNGRVVKVKTGGEKPSQQLIDAYSNRNQISNGYGGFTSPFVVVDGQYRSINDLSNDQAKAAGFGKSLDRLRKLQAQRRKDKATQEKMRDLYAKINEKADYVVPFGTESEFEIQDGVCMLKSLSQRNYSTKSKEVSSQLTTSKESCEEIKKLHKKYETKLNECQQATEALNKEYWDNFGSKKAMNNMGGYVGGMAGGYAGGIAGGYPGGMAGGYMAGGYVGGMAGGYAGGIAGGYTGGMAGGYMAGGYAGGMVGGSHGGTSSITSDLWSCEYYHGVAPIQSGSGYGGGISGGFGAGSATFQ